MHGLSRGLLCARAVGRVARGAPCGMTQGKHASILCTDGDCVVWFPVALRFGRWLLIIDVFVLGSGRSCCRFNRQNTFGDLGKAVLKEPEFFLLRIALKDRPSGHFYTGPTRAIVPFFGTPKNARVTYITIPPISGPPMR